MNETPRTDAAILPHYAGAPGVDIGVCRQIERELAAAEKRIAVMRGYVCDDKAMYKDPEWMAIDDVKDT